MLEYLMQLDRELFLFLNGLHAPWLDQIMFWISDKYVWIPLYMFLVWLCIRYYGWRTLLLFFFFLVLITMSDQTTTLLKNYFQRLRPSRDDTFEGLVHLVNEYRGGKYSFVSAHSANSFAIAVFMIKLLRDKVNYIIPLMLTFAILNAYSRIYLGVHYPGDILFGAMLGTAVAFLVFELWKLADKRIYFNKPKPSE